MEIKKTVIFFLFNFLFRCPRFNFNFWWGNRIMFFINIIVVLDKCSFYGWRFPICCTFYISILGEFIYNCRWRAMRKLLFSLVYLHSGRFVSFCSNFVKWKEVERENLLFHLLIMILYQPYSQWHWFQHDYSNFHSITVPSPKEASSQVRQKCAM